MITFFVLAVGEGLNSLHFAKMIESERILEAFQHFLKVRLLVENEQFFSKTF